MLKQLKGLRVAFARRAAAGMVEEEGSELRQLMSQGYNRSNEGAGCSSLNLL